MLKKIICLMVLFSLNANAVVTDSKTVTTENVSGKNLLEENFDKISDLKTKLTDIEGTLAKFQTCEAKNKTYMGLGVSGADSDDCLDIQNTPVKRKSKKPEFKKFSGVPKTGQLVDSLGQYLPATKSDFWGRARADKLCRDAEVGSRAMTVDDLKYVYKDLIKKIDAGNFTGTGANSIWLFDGWQSVIDTDTALPKFNFGKDVGTCGAWTSITGTGLVLEIKTSADLSYLQQDTESCAAKALIACVK